MSASMKFGNGDVTIEGLNELIDAFVKLGDDALPYLKDAANEAGNVVLAKAKAKAPVLTGTTKAKLKLIKAKPTQKKPYRIIAKISAGKGSAPIGPLELGHKLVLNGKTVGAVEARPFLRPAADESKETVANILTKAMEKAIENMGGLK